MSFYVGGVPRCFGLVETYRSPGGLSYVGVLGLLDLSFGRDPSLRFRGVGATVSAHRGWALFEAHVGNRLLSVGLVAQRPELSKVDSPEKAK